VPGGKVDSWASVFEPAAAMGGHVSLLREVTDLIGSVLIYLGKSPNSSKDADLAEVVRLLRSIKPRLEKFSSDTYIDELAAGETWLAQGWSGDVFQSQDQNPDVSYGTLVSLAKPLLPPEQLSDPAIYPPSSIKLSIVTVTGPKLQKWQAAYDEVV
jgi:hypothetical protein